MEQAREQARTVVELSLLNAQRIIEAHAGELGALDSAAGDGDHGTTMVRGLLAANRAVGELGEDVSAGMVLVSAGSAFSDAAGGASGALFGIFLLTAGQKLDDGPFDAAGVHAALQTATETVSKMGKAQVGDKTLLDTLAPFVDALGEGAGAGLDLTQAWQEALPAADKGAASTAGMVARRGRASRLGERSRDGLDPGAVSMRYLLHAVDEALAEVCPPSPSI
jgi:dihydroxyacetone kinase phosphoprotein-dependent L subunit